MKLKIYGQDGKQKGTVELSDRVFGGRVDAGLLHTVVTAMAANRRQGTAKTKGRAEVRGGGKKPWRQKGTGHARAGSNASPVWVRGGKAFGPAPRSYRTRIPRKMRVAALKGALSSRAQADRMVVVDDISCDPPKTKTVATMLRSLPLERGRSLIVTDGVKRNLYQCGRNIRDLTIMPLGMLNAATVVGSENVILCTKDLVGKLEEAVRS